MVEKMSLPDFLGKKPLSLEDAFVNSCLQKSPEDILIGGFSGVLKEVAEMTGSDEGVLRELWRKGELEKILGFEMTLVSSIALRALLERIVEGEVSEDLLLRAATELAKTGQKVAGREVQKSFVFTPEDLERIIEGKVGGEEDGAF